MTVNLLQPKLIIHGGAGGHLQSEAGVEAVRQVLHSITDKVYTLLLNNISARDAVIEGCQLLEDQQIGRASCRER